MTSTVNHVLNEQPKLLLLFSKAILGGKKKQGTLPVINASLKNVSANKAKLKAYAKVCGFQNSQYLPSTYPHILAFPLHLKILVSDEFPYPLLGLVHVSNQITQYRKINLNESLDYLCSLTGKRDVEKGEEFDIHTRVESNGELVWESVSTMLNRSKSSDSGSKAAPTDIPNFGTEKTELWTAKNNIGRRYARVSGDFNFIHLHKFSAILFGFKNAIAHGMWSKARLLAALEKDINSEAFKINVKFKLPVFLPADVQLQYKTVNKQDIEFQLMDKTGDKPHLAGSVTIL